MALLCDWIVREGVFVLALAAVQRFQRTEFLPCTRSARCRTGLCHCLSFPIAQMFFIMSQTMLMPAEMELVDDIIPRQISPPAFITEIESRFNSSPYLAVRSISCGFSQGRLVIRGCVPTFHTKQVALSVVRSVLPLDEILDLIEVTPLGQLSDPGSSDTIHRRTLPVKAR